MLDLTYKVLDVLSRRIGIPTSISESKREIKERYNSAHYANTYEKIKQLEQEEIILLAKIGKSTLVSLNFDSYVIVDMLAEMEFKRKREFVRGRQELQILLSDIYTHLLKIPLISYALLIYPEKNARLNKIEMLVHLKESNAKRATGTKINIHTAVKRLQRIYNIRIDCLTLEDIAFLDLLKSNEHNMIREMLYDKIVILHPQDFWLTVKDEVSGVKVSDVKCEDVPKIDQKDITYNLARFGYTGIGNKVEQGKLFCIEYIITAVMFHDDIRTVESIPVIIAKNPKIKYDLLLFLAQKYEFGDRLLGILRALRDMPIYEIEVVDEPIKLLETTGVKEANMDINDIKERLRVYNVTR